MRFTTPLALGLALVSPFFAVAEEPERASPEPGVSFWLAPKTGLDLSGLSPVPVKLLAAPDGTRKFALLKIGDIDPRGPLIDAAHISDKGRAVAAGVLEAVLSLSARAAG